MKPKTDETNSIETSEISGEEKASTEEKPDRTFPMRVIPPPDFEVEEVQIRAEKRKSLRPQSRERESSERQEEPDTAIEIGLQWSSTSDISPRNLKKEIRATVLTNIDKSGKSNKYIAYFG